ncbi:MAG: CNNM domain-containing protein, partial [Haemophilus parainfluenzae]|nr:CNNM domain-containing protein [Haemophilus parainfluenzae]
MSLSAAIFILIVLIIVSAILSSAEISLAGARRIKLQALANEGNIKAEKV